MYSMQAVASSLFRVVCFPFNGNIVMINQSSFRNSSVSASSGASIPIIDHSQLEIGSVGVGMYPSLMGTFSFLTPVLMIGSSIGRDSTSLNSITFREEILRFTVCRFMSTFRGFHIQPVLHWL